MTVHNRGNTELLECVLLARQVQAGELPWQVGCVSIANGIISGRVNSADACALLAEVSESINGPSELSEFEHLAHLQCGHEAFGYTAESMAAEIQDACHALVAAAA